MIINSILNIFKRIEEIIMNGKKENWDPIQAALFYVKYLENCRSEAIDRQRRIENKAINLCTSVSIFITILGYILVQISTKSLMPANCPEHINDAINIVLYIILLSLNLSWLLILLTTMTSRIYLNQHFHSDSIFTDLTKDKQSLIDNLKFHCMSLEDMITPICISSEKKQNGFKFQQFAYSSVFQYFSFY